jgi:O-antigen/teichoic acid export membrane protein
LVALGLLVMFALAYQFVPWPAVFNVKSAQAQAEVGPAVAVFVACFALAMPIGIVGRVQMALQRGFLASLWQCLASTLGLLGVVIAIQQQAGLPWLVLAFMGAPLLASVLNAWVFFDHQQPDIAPMRAAVSRSQSVQLLRTGGLFLVLQLVAAVTYASDSFVIAHLLGASAVADYAVPERMFSLITLVLAMVLAPLWPAYGEAIARGDSDWVRRTLRRSVVIAVGLAAVCSFTLVWLSDWILKVWVGDAIQPVLWLLLGLAVWKTVEAGGNALAVFLNGAHVVRSQVVVAICTACAALALKLVLVPKVGVAGAVWATIAAYLMFTALPFAVMLPRIVRRVGTTAAGAHA